MSRITKVQAWLKEQEMDCLLVTAKVNVRYLSGFRGTFGYVLVSESEAWFLTDSRYALQAQEQCPECKVVVLNHFALPLVVKQLMDSRELAVLGLEKAHITMAFYEGMVKQFGHKALMMTEGVVERLRMVKDEEEIRLIARAEEIGDLAFTHILEYLKPGVTEKEIALEMEFFMRKQGASSLSFDTIVASGKRSQMPHGLASDKVIEAGDLVTMDYGCIYEGYCSDMTRTVAVGSVTEEQKEIYHLVKRAQEAAIEAVRADVTGDEVDAVARRIFAEKHLEGYFGHGLGHSLGLEIHEEPRFSKGVKERIPENAVLSVEPGLYLHGFGVRIEDIVVVEKDGCRNLTHSPKELIIL